MFSVMYLTYWLLLLFRFSDCAGRHRVVDCSILTSYGRGLDLKLKYLGAYFKTTKKLAICSHRHWSAPISEQIQ